MAVALNVSISFLKATKAGGKLVAEAKEKHEGGKVATHPPHSPAFLSLP